MGDADAEVVQTAAVPQREFSELVDGVVADAQVCGGLVGGLGFCPGCKLDERALGGRLSRLFTFGELPSCRCWGAESA
jgi:hypothetical protein